MKTTTKIIAGATVSAALVLMPFVVAHAQSAESEVNVTVQEGISLAVSGDVNITAVANSGVGTGSHNVTVTTNNVAGYDLNLESAEASTALEHGTSSATIPAAPTTAGTLAADTWGYRTAATPANQYAGITPNGTQTVIGGSNAAGVDTTAVTYGVNVATAEPGAYNRTVVYTATTR